MAEPSLPALLALDIATLTAGLLYGWMAGVVRMLLVLWGVFVLSAFVWHTADRHYERQGLTADRSLREKTAWGVMRLAGHVFMTLYVGDAYLGSDLEWATWCPGTPAPADLLFVNDVAFGIWLFTLVSYVYFQERRKDFYIMTGHHIVTVYLLWVSRYTDMVPYGLAIMLLHDLSDIPISLMQINHDLKNERQSVLWYAVTTALVWPATRIAWLGYLLWSIAFWIPAKCTMPPLYLPTVALATLLFMQLRWYYALVRIGYKMAVEGRSPAEAESQVTAGGR